MQSIIKIIKQIILYYTELNKLKNIKDLKFLQLYQVIVFKFTNSYNI